MTSARNSRLLNFRLVLIDGSLMRLLTLRNPDGVSLPHESIRIGRRFAHALTDAIRRRFDLHTMQLTVLPESASATRCAVHEILHAQPQSRATLSFEKLENIPTSEITEEEREAVERIMKGQETTFGRFGRFGWIDDFMARIGLDIDRNSIRHLNQGFDFCLMTFRDIRGASFWFKAVGEPNLREYAITHLLVRRFPAFLPRIVTSVPEWSGWVAEHVEGMPLDMFLSLNGWTRVLKSLTALQEEAAMSISMIREAGATDCGCAHLKAALDPFIEQMQRAMHAQTSTAVAQLSDDELDQMRAQLVAAITILEDSGIPNSLLHRDIGHGNVIVSPTGAKFLDWAEAGIGHPFLSAEHLLASHECIHPMGGSERQVLRDFYARLWNVHASTRQIELATKSSPAVAALAYGIDTWESSATRSCPEHVWPFLRSIVRRTKRELEAVSGSLA